MVAYKDGTDIRLVSRAGKDHARRFSELAAAIRALPPSTLILDGEVAIFDDRLISRFEWFRKRPEDAASTPPIYMAFDCLYLDGRDLRALSFRERHEALERVVENDHTLIFPARRLADNGQRRGTKC
jgi:bifunctional non-homologous end joining protein LigD